MEVTGRRSTRIVLMGIVTMAILVSLVMLRVGAAAQRAPSCNDREVLIGTYATE